MNRKSTSELVGEFISKKSVAFILDEEKEDLIDNYRQIYNFINYETETSNA